MEIVRRAQAGDREAFEMLVERHATETYRLAAAIVGEADARDVAQESFVAAWRQLPRLRDADSFAAWLRRITVNRCRNWLRARGRRGRPTSLEADEAAHLPDPRRDFRGAVEARMVLEPAFDALSVDQRAVLALHYSMGYSIAETADALDLRVGTAKSRLNAGLAALRTAIGSDDAASEPEVAS
ncbi:MAG TPA: RNA polymerase sigma factor [Candidatus Limnocylindrales bacterium]|nr:RNA polymerase sigma factor [Candidatus Limnocylindrales bacterium]